MTFLVILGVIDHAENTLNSQIEGGLNNRGRKGGRNKRADFFFFCQKKLLIRAGGLGGWIFSKENADRVSIGDLRVLF